MVKEKKRQAPKKPARPSAPKKQMASEPVQESASKRQTPSATPAESALQRQAPRMPVQEAAPESAPAPKSLAAMLAEMGQNKGFMAAKTQGEGRGAVNGGKALTGQAAAEMAHGAPSAEAPPASLKPPPPARDILSLMEEAPWAKKASSRLARPASAVKEPAPPVALWSQVAPATEAFEEKMAEEDKPVLPHSPAPEAPSPAPSWQTLLESQPWLQRMRPVLHSPEVQEPKQEPGLLGDMLSDKRVSTPLQELISQKVSADSAPSHLEPLPALEVVAQDAKEPSPPQSPPVLADPVMPQAAPAASEEEATDPSPFSEPSEASLAAEKPLEKTVSDDLEQLDEPERQAEKAPALLADLLANAKSAAPAHAPAPSPVPKPITAKSPPKPDSILREPERKEIPVEDLLGGVISLFGAGVKGVSSLFRRKSGARK
ncbi:MAG: hypothetical protein HQL43_11365 [Alphaproteobacteria bacterium]|nr:hypothetical protein [Alphaproteobacteria bacterium]